MYNHLLDTNGCDRGCILRNGLVTTVRQLCSQLVLPHGSSASVHRIFLQFLCGACLFCTPELQDPVSESVALTPVKQRKKKKKKKRQRAVCTESLLSLPDTLQSSCSGDYDLWRSLLACKNLSRITRFLQEERGREHSPLSLVLL